MMFNKGDQRTKPNFFEKHINIPKSLPQRKRRKCTPKKTDEKEVNLPRDNQKIYKSKDYNQQHAFWEIRDRGRDKQSTEETLGSRGSALGRLCDKLTCFLLPCLQSVLNVANSSHGLWRSRSHAFCSCSSVGRADSMGRKKGPKNKNQ